MLFGSYPFNPTRMFISDHEVEESRGSGVEGRGGITVECRTSSVARTSSIDGLHQALATRHWTLAGFLAQQCKRFDDGSIVFDVVAISNGYEGDIVFGQSEFSTGCGALGI